MPGLVQRVVINVGCVDFCSVAEIVKPQCFCKADGQSIGLFAGGAPGTPCSNGLIGNLVGDDCRDDFLAQKIPRTWISEERSDIYEDGIEQLDKLVRMYLEIIDV